MASGAASRCSVRFSIPARKTNCATSSSRRSRNTKRRWQRRCKVRPALSVPEGALGRQRPFGAQAFLELGFEEARFHAAVDDEPWQERLIGSIAIQIGLGVEARFGDS